MNNSFSEKTESLREIINNKFYLKQDTFNLTPENLKSIKNIKDTSANTDTNTNTNLNSNSDKIDSTTNDLIMSFKKDKHKEKENPSSPLEKNNTNSNLNTNTNTNTNTKIKTVNNNSSKKIRNITNMTNTNSSSKIITNINYVNNINNEYGSLSASGFDNKIKISTRSKTKNELLSKKRKNDIGEEKNENFNLENFSLEGSRKRKKNFDKNTTKEISGEKKVRKYSTNSKGNSDDEILAYQTPVKLGDANKFKLSPVTNARKNLMDLFGQIKKK
jgi:hypothetical protein